MIGLLLVVLNGLVHRGKGLLGSRSMSGGCGSTCTAAVAVHQYSALAELGIRTASAAFQASGLAINLPSCLSQRNPGISSISFAARKSRCIYSSACSFMEIKTYTLPPTLASFRSLWSSNKSRPLKNQTGFFPYFWPKPIIGRTPTILVSQQHIHQ
jgi:hypothetical protein